MLEYLAYGAIGISMATAILTFRLLSSEQRKENPNESILKMIKLFMVLTVFFAVFFGVVELIKGDGEEAPVNFVSSIDQVKDKQLETFALQKNQLDGKKVDVVLYYDENGKEGTNSAILGKLNPNVKQDFKAAKNDNNEWDVLLGEARLGRVFSSWNVLSKRGRRGEWVNVGKWHRLNKSTGQPSNFWFKIDEIHWVHRTDTTGNYRFTVNFGEGESESAVSRCSEGCVFYETINGKINLTKLRPLSSKHWKRDYFVAFGAGQPTKSNPATSVIDRVELYNAYALQTGLD
jgi:hypothetical protein